MPWEAASWSAPASGLLLITRRTAAGDPGSWRSAWSAIRFVPACEARTATLTRCTVVSSSSSYVRARSCPASRELLATVRDHADPRRRVGGPEVMRHIRDTGEGAL